MDSTFFRNPTAATEHQSMAVTPNIYIILHSILGQIGVNRMMKATELAQGIEKFDIMPRKQHQCNPCIQFVKKGHQYQNPFRGTPDPQSQ